MTGGNLNPTPDERMKLWSGENLSPIHTYTHKDAQIQTHQMEAAD